MQGPPLPHAVLLAPSVLPNMRPRHKANRAYDLHAAAPLPPGRGVYIVKQGRGPDHKTQASARPAVPPAVPLLTLLGRPPRLAALVLLHGLLRRLICLAPVQQTNQTTHAGLRARPGAGGCVPIARVQAAAAAAPAITRASSGARPLLQSRRPASPAAPVCMHARLGVCVRACVCALLHASTALCSAAVHAQR